MRVCPTYTRVDGGSRPPALAAALFVLVALLVGCAAAAPVTLPDYTGPPLRLDSGYIEVNATTGRNVFFILSRVLAPVPNAPLLFWYQGGPGW